ncbi:unnamed protein product, partial [Discosporangium mesarthrocarpum]
RQPTPREVKTTKYRSEKRQASTVKKEKALQEGVMGWGQERTHGSKDYSGGVTAALKRLTCPAKLGHAVIPRSRHSILEGNSWHRICMGNSKAHRPWMSPLTLVLIAVIWVVGNASGWSECRQSEHDRWALSDLSYTVVQQREFPRRYTCGYSHGASVAALYRFFSECTAKTFRPQHIQTCLKGRRVIFIGDSLSTQQGDSLVAMLGWRPEWLRLGSKYNIKVSDLDHFLYQCFKVLQKGGIMRACISAQGNVLSPFIWGNWKTPVSSLPHRRTAHMLALAKSRPQRCPWRPIHTAPVLQWHIKPDGTREPGLNLCWRFPDPYRAAREIGRCYDAFTPSGDHTAAQQAPTPEDYRKREGEGEASWLQRADVDRPATGVSVHVRMFDKPKGNPSVWLERVLLDFNGTRDSDIYVVNFGAHYPERNNTLFEKEMGPFLEALKPLSREATVVWREASPTHFPGGVNGTYEEFMQLPMQKRRNACCTGTPAPVSDQNLFVERYLQEKGLADQIHLLRIYQMSKIRASSHRTCRAAGPNVQCQKSRQFGLDCRHWTEPGVVEDWNRLLLNHLCP